MRNIFEQLTGKPRGAINTDPLDRMPTETLALGRMAAPPDPAEFDAAKAPTPTLSLAPDGMSAPKSDEPDYAGMSLEELVSAWQKKRTDAATSAVLKRLDPTIRSAINSYAPGMERQMRVKAANLALEALSTYDPNRGANPATHVFSNLRRLSRLGAKASAIMPEPEGVVLDRNKLQRAIDTFTDDRGREPSMQELADLTGLSVKRIDSVLGNQTKVVSESSTLMQDSLKDTRGSSGLTDTDYLEYVYASSGPIEQKIIEWSSGLHGKQRLSNNEIARRLGISPAAVSQRRNKIDRLMSEVREVL